ncbi:tRNA 2-thiouridine(34) synthase MnmA [Actinomyces minihominis]|uniref:tRNA 2-thiouridine(34) synthase MnmA n=1 Tax=Actinomyces minihominis TaxID=2002838 RepID=UPI000C08700F|nr:tRNA 2-thiouridine(34) synthase MnmA [Actinomyces minihominis]
MRVLAALSGGVDSAVAAALAVEAGHDVTAVHMALSSEPQACRVGSRGCCSLEDSQDAARAAEIMGIPYYVWDLSQQFEDAVIDDFLSEYRAGHTPNPCVRCNEFVKFRELLERGLALGFDAVCTGHYAKLIHGESGPELHRGNDELKDQSYVLAVMGSEDLSHVLLPLGEAPDKAWVREQAELRGLGVSNKPDSYDICFIPDGDTGGFLERHLGSAPGDIVDTEGNVLGEHDGYYRFTIGQRKGLRIGRPSESGRPRYVLETDPSTNTVVVGESTLLSVDTITTRNLVWQSGPSELEVNQEAQVAFGATMGGRGLNEVPSEVLTAQIRAHGTPSVITSVQVVEGAGEHLVVTLAEPIRGVAPGQSLVLYRGSRVVAEGTIASSTRVGSRLAPSAAPVPA